MRSVTIIILHALVVNGLDKNLADTSVDEFANKFVNKLMDRVLGASCSLRGANLDDTTFAKTHADRGFGLPSSAVQSRLASLPGPTVLKNLVASRIQEVNGGFCPVPRDVSMKAEAAAEPPAEEIAVPETKMATYDARLMYSPAIEPMSKAKIQDMAGVTAPFGVFDPLGISTKVPEGQLMFYREAELKHGRVCMLAILGLVVGDRHDFFPILGEGIPADKLAWEFGGPYAQETPLANFWPIVVGALFVEEWRHEYYRKENPDLAPGDYGWDPLKLKPKDAKGFKDLQNKELNNGRLAMLAAAGMIAQELATGQKIF